MRSHKMSLGDRILELLRTPAYRHKGMRLNALGLPIFFEYKHQSLINTLYRYKKKQYVSFVGGCWKISSEGERYFKKRSAYLRIFQIPKIKDPKRTLLFMFDVPEERKAERNWLRSHLKKFGFIMIQKSVWVGPLLPKDFTEYMKHIKLSSSIKTFKLARPYIDKNK